ncbi:unnamed protein product [Clonostachys solani]|uniref:Uncharacterized protein n=1 Tax=Clonostachys solani TaxID=160281 RepID=A0A9N9ZED4_9HYPO|nr:unnamed protein product [Clonostachys solani]
METSDSVSFSHIPREVSPLSSGRAEDGSKNSDGYGDQPPGGDDEMKELPEMTEDISKEQSGSILSRWWPEFIACAIAVAAFCALIGTVYPYQGQPLPRWPYGLGINTLISIYTVIFEMATVMVVSSGLGQLKFLWFQSSRKLSDLGTFDQGGRGAWGALLLIWRLRTRYVLASIGSLVIVLGIFLSPFSQQLVKYDSCIDTDPSIKATIPRTNFVSSVGTNHLGAAMADVDQPAQAAINTGLFDNVPAAVTPFCPSGNCTFPTQYASAGYCRVCEDYTDRTVLTGNMTKPNVTVKDWSISSNGSSYGFVLGSGTGPYPGIRMLFSTGQNETARQQSIDKCEGGITGGNWTCLGFGAAECSVRPCALRYNASLVQGVFTENITSFTTDMRYTYIGAVGISAVDLKCTTAAEQDYLRSKNYTWDNSMDWLPYNMSNQIFTTAYNESDSLRDECIYQGNTQDLRSLTSFFAEYFNGNLAYGFMATGTGNTIPGRAIYNMAEFNFTHLDTKFRNLATSMTAYARSRTDTIPEEATVLFEGEINTWRTCVVVRWPWITLQAVILLLMAFFFALTLLAVEGTDNDTIKHDFKTSILPLLFHGLHSDTLESVEHDAPNMARIQQHAGHIRVKVARRRTGWGFEEAYI